jgi:hypothetical protein
LSEIVATAAATDSHKSLNSRCWFIPVPRP